MIMVIAIVAILLSMGLLLIRLYLGPTAYDRILAVNLFGTGTVLCIALLSFLHDDMMFLDMALLYGLINFTATIALLRYFKYRSFDEHE